MVLIACISVSIRTSLHASSDSLSEYIRNTQKRAGIQSAAVVACIDGNVEYLQCEDDTALYQIGSMTKAFTGLGILYLEQEGKLSLSMPIDEYIPEFTALYHGKETEITIDNLLRMQSGFTNSETDYPSAKKKMSLNEWMLSINHSELTYKPGNTYSYSNVNYNLLGLVIERVTGQSYAEFMQKSIFVPLGLNDTYCGHTYGTRKLCEGTRLGYGMAFPYSLEIKDGSIPAGYIYSCLKDMSRWMQIQMGYADIPESYVHLIKKSHDILLTNGSGKYYAGWEKWEDDVLGHSGGTANYSSRMVFSEQNGIGVCVLTNLNAASTTDNMCNQIYLNYRGEEASTFVYDVWRIFDTIFSIISLVIVLHMVVISLLQQRGKRKKSILILSFVFVFVTLITFNIVLPLVFQANIITILLTWAPYSMAGGFILMLGDLIYVSYWLTSFANPDKSK